MPQPTRGPRCPHCRSIWVTPYNQEFWLCLHCYSIFIHRTIMPEQMRLTDFGAVCGELSIRMEYAGFDP